MSWLRRSRPQQRPWGLESAPAPGSDEAAYADAVVAVAQRVLAGIYSNGSDVEPATMLAHLRAMHAGGQPGGPNRRSTLVAVAAAVQSPETNDVLAAAAGIHAALVEAYNGG